MNYGIFLLFTFLISFGVNEGESGETPDLEDFPPLSNHNFKQTKRDHKNIHFQDRNGPKKSSQLEKKSEQISNDSKTEEKFDQSKRNEVNSLPTSDHILGNSGKNVSTSSSVSKKDDSEKQSEYNWNFPDSNKYLFSDDTVLNKKYVETMDNDKSQKDSHSSEEKENLSPPATTNSVKEHGTSASTNQPKYSAKDKQKWKMLNPLAAEFNPKRSFESLPQGYDQIHHPNNQIISATQPGQKYQPLKLNPLVHFQQTLNYNQGFIHPRGLLPNHQTTYLKAHPVPPLTMPHAATMHLPPPLYSFPVNPPPAFVPQSGQQVIVPPPSLHLHHNGSVPKDQRANFYNNGQNKHYHKNGYNYKREYHSKNNQFPNNLPPRMQGKKNHQGNPTHHNNPIPLDNSTHPNHKEK